jgi:hypothetical protein
VEEEKRRKKRKGKKREEEKAGLREGEESARGMELEEK